MQFDAGNLKLLFAFIHVALMLLDSYLTELQPELGVTRCWIFALHIGGRVDFGQCIGLLDTVYRLSLDIT